MLHRARYVNIQSGRTSNYRNMSGNGSASLNTKAKAHTSQPEIAVRKTQLVEDVGSADPCI